MVAVANMDARYAGVEAQAALRKEAGPLPMSPLTSASQRGKAVTLGPVLPEDTAKIFVWLNDVEAAAQDLSYRPIDYMNYNGWLENFSRNASQVLFAIRPISEGRLLRFVTFTKIDAVHRSAQLGIRIGGESDRGKGHGADAVGAALGYAWRVLNLNRVYLDVFAFNTRAISAYSKVGFQVEGRMRQAAFINGAWTDVILMGALRPE